MFMRFLGRAVRKGPSARSIQTVCAFAVAAAVVATGSSGSLASGDAFARDATKDLVGQWTVDDPVPYLVWSDGATMWVLEYISRRVHAFDPATGDRQPDLDVPTVREGAPHPRGFWSDGFTVWVLEGFRDTIAAYDLATGNRLIDKEIDLEKQVGGEGHILDRSGHVIVGQVGMWSDGTTVWVSDRYNNKVHAYELATGDRQADKDINNLASAGNSNPTGLWSDGTTMWVVDESDEKIYAYDLVSGARRSHLDFNTLRGAGNHNPRGIWSDGATMWVADSEDQKLYAYNMPAGASLRSLEFSGADFGAFAAGRFEYAARVPASVASTTVAAAAASAGATVDISPDDADSNTDGHQIDLSAGDNTVTVTVTNGEATTTYTAVINRMDDAELSELSLSGTDLGSFSPDTLSYTVNVANDVAATTVTAAADDALTTVTISPADSDRETDGHQVSLEVGMNIVSVAVTSATERDRTYTVTVNRASADPFGWDPTRGIDELWSSGSHRARGLWSDGTALWVVDDIDHQIYAYDLETGARRAGKDVAHLNEFGNSYALSVWSDGATIWVSQDWIARIFAYDLDTGTRRVGDDLWRLMQDGVFFPHGIWSDGTTMWVADRQDDRLVAYELATGHRQATKDIGSLRGAGNGSPTGLWSNGTTIWAADESDAKIYAYDLVSGARKSHLEFNTLRGAGNHDPQGIWSDGITMWVSDSLDDRVYAYNMPTGALLQSMELSGVDIGTFGTRRLEYAANVPASVASTTVTAAAASDGATVDISPDDADVNTEGHQVDLSRDSTVTVTVTNGEDTATYTVTITRFEVATVNQPAAGAPVISGSPDVGGTVTADVSCIADPDGLADALYAYRWLADGTVISGANGSSYTLAQSDHGRAVTVRVSFTDDDGNAESLTSEPVSPVLRLPPVLSSNHPATGRPRITGTAQVGETLTADISDISDEDGLANASYSYQWLTSEAGTDSEIAGATQSSYQLTDSEARLAIKVRVSFTDDADNAESVTSELLDPTRPSGLTAEVIDGAVSLTWTAPAQFGYLLDYQITRRRCGSDDAVIDTRNSQTSYVDAGVEPGVLYVYTVKAGSFLHLSESSLPVEVRVLGSPATGVPVISVEDPAGSTLAVDTTGITDADGLESVSFSYQWLLDDVEVAGATGASYTTSPADRHRAIAVRVSFSDDNGDAETLTSAPFYLARPNYLTATVSEGSVVLTWQAPAQFRNLFDYQILRGRPKLGEAEPAAYVDTRSTETTFVDDGVEPGVLYVYAVKAGSFFTGLASLPVEVRVPGLAASVNRAATGAPVISGLVAAGETLAVDTSGIADINGLESASFSYQWLADGADIEGATGDSYVLTESDTARTVTVRVSFSDDAGHAETLTSRPPLTAVVHDVPASHDGTTAFTFKLRFSEELSPDRDKFSYKTLLNHAFTVTGGKVITAKRLESPVKGQNQNVRWAITIEPNTTGSVTVTLPATDDCDDTGAVCTDDGRKLATLLELTVTHSGG